jgi:hypothetical protein
MKEYNMQQLLLHLSKPVLNLSDQTKRNDPAVMSRNLDHLAKVTV